jgi:Mn-dependent DtxR family transcriptional regulator
MVGREETEVPMLMQEAAQMYLETIYVLNMKHGFVRSVDIANEMGYSKPTISEWMGKLQDNGYIIKRPDGGIELTEAGLETAKSVYEKHELLTNLFESIGVSPETASDDACRVEHYISDETFEALKKHYKEEHGGA